MAARPCVAVFMLGAAALYNILRQMHQQNPEDAPTESRGTTSNRCPPTASFALTACVLLQRFDAAAILPANGSAAFNVSVMSQL